MNCLNTHQLKKNDRSTLFEKIELRNRFEELLNDTESKNESFEQLNSNKMSSDQVAEISQQKDLFALKNQVDLPESFQKQKTCVHSTKKTKKRQSNSKPSK